MILDCEHKDGGRCGRNQIPFQTKQLQQRTLLERNLLHAAGGALPPPNSFPPPPNSLPDKPAAAFK